MNSGNLKYQYARLSIAEKLIAVNVFVFIINGLFTFLMGMPSNSLLQWFELPKDFIDFISQPWSLVTYSFFHGGIWHLFWNMVMLYFSGRIFLNLFGPKKFTSVYFLGVILGGLVFLLSYNVFPALLSTNTALIGVFFVLVDLVQIPSGGNAGGHLAHLGGALLGYVYARQLLRGRDIGEGFIKILESIEDLFKKKEKKAPLKTVYRRAKGNRASSVNYDRESKQRKIDTILDKISKSGYESLSKSEKDFLFKAGKED